MASSNQDVIREKLLYKNQIVALKKNIRVEIEKKKLYIKIIN